MTSALYRFGCPFSSKRLWFVDTVLWLCPSLPTETLKWLSSLPILMQKSFWWWQCSDRYIISLSPPTPLPHLHTPFLLFSPFLMSRTVSVDVKHHVYLLTYLATWLGRKTWEDIGKGNNLKWQPWRRFQTGWGWHPTSPAPLWGGREMTKHQLTISFPQIIDTAIISYALGILPPASAIIGYARGLLPTTTAVIG